MRQALVRLHWLVLTQPITGRLAELDAGLRQRALAHAAAITTAFTQVVDTLACKVNHMASTINQVR